ncbi:MAG: hypothetical protein DSY42_09565 [Aquifex sp.]|nr:MAG: hypothetical protein DSY42_09565 [Aquifex sp.]
MKKSYVANVVIRTPQVGINRDSVAVPRGFHLLSVSAFIPPDSLLDIKDNNKSIFGKNPIGGGIFNTFTRTFNFPVPVPVETTELDIELELHTATTDPVFITLTGVVEE